MRKKARPRGVRWTVVAAAAAAVATTSLVLFVGCDRNDGAANSSTRAGSSKPSSAQVIPAVSNGPRRVENDPGKLLFAAMLDRNLSEVAKVLDQHPGLVNQPINDSPPLWTACEWRAMPLVKLLVEKGADVKLRDEAGDTALWAAVSSGSMPIVKYLIEKGLDPKTSQEDDETLLWVADTREMAAFLIDAGVDPKHKDRFGDTALHQACRHSLRDVVELLLDKGLNIEEPGHWGMRPLHSAASTVTGEPRPVVDLLLQRGADINSRGYNGHTALHECALYNRLDMANRLLARGARVDLKDNDGRTPKDIAVFAGQNERARLINLLIQHGAGGQLIPIPKQ
ncbi:MAG TPA: ankyrin repeat domain-containing protein [Tepidisphaeraceae bacterium]